MRPKCYITFMCDQDFECFLCERGKTKDGVVKECDDFTPAEKIAALVDALKELGVDVPQWMPIKSAPKNGEHILIYEPDGFYVIEGLKHGDDWLTFPGLTQCFPTHWMPLPTKPTE